MDYKLGVISALVAHIFWSAVLLYLVILGITFNILVSYGVCCFIFLVFSTTYFYSKDKEWYIKVMTTFSVMLISPLLIYMSWLYSMYSLMSRLEKVV